MPASPALRRLALRVARVLPALLLALPLAPAAGGQPDSVLPSTATAPPAPPAPAAPARPRLRPRRVPVSAELARTAFADADARPLLERARAARLAQDSALGAYDATAVLRMTVGMTVRALGRERLLLRTEHAARVQWGRGRGLWVEPTGRRTAFPLGGAALDLTAATPVPYFPGRESLWLPFDALGGVARAEVDENQLLHPLAVGAEAYYRYATGGSLGIRLPDGARVTLRELRVTARRPEWRAFVGSFWFDVERGSLVRAAYRTAAPVEIWGALDAEQRRTLGEWEERARTDTGAAARAARAEAERVRRDARATGGLGGRLLRASVTPLRADVSAITVEYGLHEGRFWLPRAQTAEGWAQGGFVRLPVRVEERFRYEGVNGTAPIPVVGTPAELGLAADDTTWWGGGSIDLDVPLLAGRSPADTTAAGRAARAARLAAREDTLVAELRLRADTLAAAAARSRAAGDTLRARQLDEHAAWHAGRLRRIARRRAACGRGDGTYVAGTTTRHDGALRIAVRMPCDTSRFATSPDLPGALLDPAEETVGDAEREALLAALGLGLQARWGPERPVLHAGLDLVRYNRIEGLSVGASATSALGLGYTAQALARFGVADRVPNGELSLARSDARRTVRVGAFHRLAVVNDDRGAPLAFGASVANLLYARDEGFYYRTWGAELAGSRASTGPLGRGGPLGGASILWRAFVERQRGAGRAPNTQASLGRLLGGARFGENVEAVPLTALGLGAELARTVGVESAGLRLDLRLRGEGAFTSRADSVGRTGYGRLTVDASLARRLGGAAVGLAAMAGTSAGALPPQRAFHVGGVQTVRGQWARAEGAGRVGDAFWLGRAEAGFAALTVRPSLFADVGWAGPRGELLRRGRPLSGVGTGVSLLDGVVRVDVARGVWPERRWRTDLSLEARF